MTDQLAEIQTIADEEVAMLKGAEDAYLARGNPKPVKQKVTAGIILRKFGPSMVMLFISLLGAMYISSVRVGVLMEITQFLLLERYKVSLVDIGTAGNVELMRWMGMAAFEGVLVAWGFYRGQHLTKAKWSGTAYYMALAVTIVAGVLAGFTLTDVQWINTFLTVIFSVISGIGGPIAVAFTAENMGYVWKEIIEIDTTFQNEWEASFKQWGDEFEKFLPYYMGQVFGVERRKKLNKFEGGDTPLEQSRTSVSQIEQLRQYLRERGLRPSEVGSGDQFRITPSQIADDLQWSGKERNNIHTHLTRLRKEETDGKWNS